MKKGAWINGRPKPCISEHDVSIAKACAVAQAIIVLAQQRWPYPYQLNDAIRASSKAVKDQ